MLDVHPTGARYPSRIEEITPHHLHFAMPMSKGVPVILLSGTKFFGKVVSDGMVWQFTSIYVDKKGLPVPLWIAEKPFDIKQIQQRNFVREQMSLSMKVSFRAVGANDVEDESLAVITKDVSGGGVLFASKKPIRVGDKIRLLLELDGKVETLGEVVRVGKSIDPTIGITWVAVSFIEIAERDRDKIIKFVFKKQMERRQKGL